MCIYGRCEMKRATYLVTELLKIFLLFSIPGSIICFASAAVEHDLAAALPLLPLWLIPLLLVFVFFSGFSGYTSDPSISGRAGCGPDFDLFRLLTYPQRE